MFSSKCRLLKGSPLWHRAVCVSQFPVLFPSWAVLRGPLLPEAGLRFHKGLFAKPQTKPCIKTNPPYGGSLLKEMGKNSLPLNVCFNAVRKKNRSCGMAVFSSMGKNEHLWSTSTETWERLPNSLLTRLFQFLTLYQDRSGFNNFHHFSSAYNSYSLRWI